MNLTPKFESMVSEFIAKSTQFRMVDMPLLTQIHKEFLRANSDKGLTLEELRDLCETYIFMPKGLRVDLTLCYGSRCFQYQVLVCPKGVLLQSIAVKAAA